ncbi:VWA domain-containing protein [Rhodoferax koreense]|uniref:VWA domain-containing protein n=1 Tax=Rhodoferax koreensis TaxID=1842727 RepID=UPI001EF4FEE1|nr:VWA domain-containing protein [Rhodoferax koreense]
MRPGHLRHRPEPPADAELHCFLLDCSASMRSSGALARAKGLLLHLFDEAYRRRHHVALLCFAGGAVELRLAPRRAAAWNEAWIAPIAGGGGTPLTLGVAAAERLLRRARARAGRRSLWLLTDGRSTEQPAPPAAADALHVIDFESARVPLARAARLAADWGAAYLRDADIRNETAGGGRAVEA